MDNLAQLQTELGALRDIRAAGVRKTRFGEDEVEFRSDAELAAAIADVEQRINSLGSRRVAMVRIHTSKGLGK